MSVTVRDVSLKTFSFDPSNAPVPSSPGLSASSPLLEVPKVAPVIAVTPAQEVEVSAREKPEMEESDQCKTHRTPWPSIIISIIGGIVVIYIAIAPGISSGRRIVGIVLMFLWALVWALILWVMWKDCHHAISWWLLLIPVVIMSLFFVLIILMNLGT